MPRVARRHILHSEGGFYHCLNRICGYPGQYPLQEGRVVADFVSRLRRCLGRCRIRCAGFVLMGNHYHLILFAEKPRRLSRDQLESLAQARWGKLWKLRTRFWSDGRWEEFNRDVFDLSVFMRDFQGPFSSWFNKTFGRRGRLWAERFKCLALADPTAVREQLLYVELNPVRANLTALPEQWRAGSAHLRAVGEDDFLIPLRELFPDLAPERVEPFYRGLLLHRGLAPGRRRQASIPDQAAARELDRRFPPGLYRRRRRFMIDGLMMGGKERLLQELERLTLEGVYRRRRRVAEHCGGLFHTIREQRSHCRW